MKYTYDSVADVMNEADRRDDLLALSIANARKETRKIGQWITESGPLPANDFGSYKQVFLDGLDEVDVFLKAEGVL
ncbi:hypothetical protein NCCP2165_12280 [Halomonas sp. NCCP-2165]|nr:hypothetical protein NCCP2165_12280 [Halomonas sp. NCCP-2165]